MESVYKSECNTGVDWQQIPGVAVKKTCTRLKVEKSPPRYETILRFISHTKNHDAYGIGDL